MGDLEALLEIARAQVKGQLRGLRTLLAVLTQLDEMLNAQTEEVTANGKETERVG